MGLVSEDFSFNDYIEGDTNLVMHKTFTEDSIANNLEASEITANQEEIDHNKNCLDKQDSIPIMALEAVKTLDHYFRIKDNNQAVL